MLITKTNKITGRVVQFWSGKTGYKVVSKMFRDPILRPILQQYQKNIGKRLVIEDIIYLLSNNTFEYRREITNKYERIEKKLFK